MIILRAIRAISLLSPQKLWNSVFSTVLLIIIIDIRIREKLIGPGKFCEFSAVTWSSLTGP